MKLSKDQRKRLDAVVSKLHEAHETVLPAVAAYNEAVAAAFAVLNEALYLFAQAEADAASEVQSIGTELREDWEEKSERWQDSEKGTAAGEAIERLESFEIDAFTIDEPEEIDEPDNHAEEVEGLLSDEGE